MTFSKSPKDLLTVKVNVFKEIHHGRGATQVWTTGLSVQCCLSTQTVGLGPFLIPPRFMRGKEYLSNIRNKRILCFWDGHPWLHAYEVVSTTCYLGCQRRRNRGRLVKVKQSGLLKFKVLKWPIINTSDGAEAVISENNSKIISPNKARLSPRGACRYARVEQKG